MSYNYEYKEDKYKSLAELLRVAGLIAKSGYCEVLLKIEDNRIVLIEKKEKIKP